MVSGFTEYMMLYGKRLRTLGRTVRLTSWQE